MGILEEFDANLNGQQPLESQARPLQKAGRRGDTVLAHLNPREVRMLDANTKGGGGINPTTGLMEFEEGGDGDGDGNDDSSDHFDWEGNAFADLLGGVDSEGQPQSIEQALGLYDYNSATGPGEGLFDYDTAFTGQEENAFDEYAGIRDNYNVENSVVDSGNNEFFEKGLPFPTSIPGLVQDLASYLDIDKYSFSSPESITGRNQELTNAINQGMTTKDFSEQGLDAADLSPIEQAFFDQSEIDNFEDFIASPEVTVPVRGIDTKFNVPEGPATPDPGQRALEIWQANKGLTSLPSYAGYAGKAATIAQILGLDLGLNKGPIGGAVQTDPLQFGGMRAGAPGPTNEFFDDSEISVDDPLFSFAELADKAGLGRGGSTFGGPSDAFNNYDPESLDEDDVTQSPFSRITSPTESDTLRGGIIGEDILNDDPVPANLDAFLDNLDADAFAKSLEDVNTNTSTVDNSFTLDDNYEDPTAWENLIEYITNYNANDDDPEGNLDELSLDTSGLQQQLRDFASSDVIQNFNATTTGATILSQLFNQLQQPLEPTEREVIPGSFQDLFNRRNDPIPESEQPQRRDFKQEVTDILTRPGHNEIDFDNEAITPQQQINKFINRDVIDLNRVLSVMPTPGYSKQTNPLRGLSTEEILGLGSRFSSIVDDESLGMGEIMSRVNDFRGTAIDEANAIRQGQRDKVLDVQGAISAFNNAQTGFDALIEERGLTGQGFATQGRADLLDILRDFTPGAGQTARFNTALNEDIGRSFADTALTNTRNNFLDFGNAQINNAFPEGGFDIDQSIIDSIVEERLGQGSQILSGQQARGNFSEAGLASANEQLQSQRGRINDQVFGLAESFVPDINRTTSDIRGRAQEANDSFQLGNDLFDVSAFTDERDTFLGDQNSGFRGQIDNAIGSDPLFDISDSLAAGRKAQGVVAGPQQGTLLDTLAAREGAGVGGNRNRRGVGTAGSGAF